jgi:hypothetical protein
MHKGEMHWESVREFMQTEAISSWAVNTLQASVQMFI